MAAGDDYIDLLNKIGENDCGENQLRKWDQEGKLYVEGTQYISPQGIQYVRECLQNQGSPLVTAAPPANEKVYHHYNHPIRNHQMVLPQADLEGTSIISDEEEEFRSLDTESLVNHDQLKQQRQCTQDPYMSVVSPAQKVTEFPMKSQKTTSSCLIDKVPLSKQDSGLADMDNWSPVEATSNGMGDCSPVEATSDDMGNWSPEEPRSVTPFAVEADQSQGTNMVRENNGPTRRGIVHMNVVINGPINGTLNINGLN